MWTNDPGEGWNLIAVPGPLDGTHSFFDAGQGFVLETIPYIETTTFTPISVTLNRGQFLKPAGFAPQGQQIQKIGAVLYEQRIKSAGVLPADGSDRAKELEALLAQRGFSKDTPLHAEQGMLLNIANLRDYGHEELQVARMGTIPHGNAMLCLGVAQEQPAPSIHDEVQDKPPFPVDPTRGMGVEYTIATYASPTHNPEGYPFYPFFNPMTPVETLQKANEGKDLVNTTHVSLSSENGTGGVLSIPFLGGGFDGTKIDTTKMTVDYWISTMKTADGNSELRLQYLQDVSIVFPSTLHPEVPIVWPHIGLNTLYRVPEGA